MTRSQALTLSRLKQHASHVHPGQVGRCDSWSCPDFLEVIGPLFDPIVVIPGGATVTGLPEISESPAVVVYTPPEVVTKKSKGKK